MSKHCGIIRITTEIPARTALTAPLQWSSGPVAPPVSRLLQIIFGEASKWAWWPAPGRGDMTLARQRLNRSSGGSRILKQWEGDTLNPERVTDSKAIEQCRNEAAVATMRPLWIGRRCNERGGASSKPSGSQSQSQRVCFSAAAAVLLHSLILS